MVRTTRSRPESFHRRSWLLSAYCCCVAAWPLVGLLGDDTGQTDRGLRSHWNPHLSKKIEILLTPPTVLHGRFVGPDGAPVANANVRLTAVKATREDNLDQHLEWLKKSSSLDGGAEYRDYLTRPWLLPGWTTDARTDADGAFRLDGLPSDRFADLEVTHPAMRTTSLTVAIREMEPVFSQPSELDPEPTLLLYGSGFTHTLEAGVSLRGRVVEYVGLGTGSPIAGATVALANHNSPDGMWGQKFSTDAEGRFELTGLGPDSRGEGYEVAVIGSFSAPIEPRRFTVQPEQESKLELGTAVAYRLTLVDAVGQPIDREVTSIEVQSLPGQIHRRATHHFNKAVRVAPGVFEGVVPRGPGAVLIERGSRRDRPVLVDPKAFFEPGRTDWTREEERHSYGNIWHIMQPGIITTERLAPNANVEHSQLDLAAVVFTNATPGAGQLELTAVVVQDDPPEVTLVDEAGHPVVGASIYRQLDRYNETGLPASFPLPALHPERAEFVKFWHEERGLIGYLRATLTTEPIRVVMLRAATIKGRIATREGEPTSDFGAIVTGAVPPETMFANRVFGGKRHERGRFEFQVVPDESYTGEIVRRIGSGREHLTRPTIGRAFGPVTPQPGETIDLGDIIVP